MFKTDPNKTYNVAGSRNAYEPNNIKFTTEAKGKVDQILYLTPIPPIAKEERVEQNRNGDLFVRIEKVYFDFNKYNVNQDAAVVLNVLIDLMKKYPNSKIDISAHTDVRGSDEYNLELSINRAASVLEYMVSQGIERNRLTSKGYGETKPINHCVKEGICDDHEYEINRRCEFQIAKIKY